MRRLVGCVVSLAVVALLGGACDDGQPSTPGEPSPGVDRQAEAQRYAPLVWLADGEKYLPMDTGSFIGRSTLEFVQPCGTEFPVQDVATDVDPARLGGKPAPYTADGCAGKPDFASDRDLGGEAGGKGFYLDFEDSEEARHGTGTTAPVYWEFYDDPDSDATAYTYWLFYGYDYFIGAINVHEADWERVGVQLANGRPTHVVYWKHNEPACRVRWLDRDRDQGHPVAYSALGSHASYDRADRFPTYPGPGLTDTTSAGTRWETWHAVHSVVDEPWWNYRGLWGTQAGGKGATGPRGPYPGRGSDMFTTVDCARAAPTTQPSGGEIDAAFLGSWSSPEPADQPTSDQTYYVRLTLREGAVGEQVGDIVYPGLDCSGTLTLVEAHPDRLVVAEHIENQPAGPCTIDGYITLTPDPAGLHFTYVRESDPEEVAVTATLTRS